MHRPVAFALGILFTVAAVACDLCLPWAASGLIDSMAAPAASGELAWRAWVFFVAVFAGFTLAKNIAHRIWIPVAARNMEELTNDLFGCVQAFPAEWHASTMAGETSRRLTRAVQGYDEVTDALTISVGPALTVLCGLSLMLLIREHSAGWLALALMFALISTNIALTTYYVRPANLTSNALDAAMSGAVTDAITANAVVKSYAAEGREGRRLSTITEQWRRSVMETWRRFVDVGFVQNLLLLLLQAGLTGAMVHAWSLKKASPGDVAFAITAFLMMSGYLRNIGENIRGLQKGIDHVADAVTFLALPREIAQNGSGACLSDIKRGISFRDLGFSYSQRQLYSGLDLTIAKGETIALVGESGGGKSTLIKLLQRLYEPNAGSIAIDGTDIRNIHLPALRRAIAVVPQDPAMFHRSIKDNIAYGRPDASIDDIRQAAATACADEFIMRLPQAYETMVGERGLKLSAGERQRIALARALLAKAPILVLDEATSALDLATESKVLQRLDAAQNGQTRIIIAHRPAAMLNADRILELRDGQLIERSRERVLSPAVSG
jgi:ATP-binding cassette subfamily B protein